jgi:hypothetical protein
LLVNEHHYATADKRLINRRVCFKTGQGCRKAQPLQGFWLFLGWLSSRIGVTCSCHWIDGTHLIDKRTTRKQFRRSILEAWDWRCAYCDTHIGNAATLDHILASSKGGLTEKGNLVACCQSCNVSKSDTLVWAWYRLQDFYCVKREAVIRLWFYKNMLEGKTLKHVHECLSVI